MPNDVWPSLFLWLFVLFSQFEYKYTTFYSDGRWWERLRRVTEGELCSGVITESSYLCENELFFYSAWIRRRGRTGAVSSWAALLGGSSAKVDHHPSFSWRLPGPSVSDLLTANHLPSSVNAKVLSSWNVRVFNTAVYNNIHVEQHSTWTSHSANEMSSAQLKPSPGRQLIFSNTFCARRWPRPRRCQRWFAPRESMKRSLLDWADARMNTWADGSVHVCSCVSTWRCSRLFHPPRCWWKTLLKELKVIRGNRWESQQLTWHRSPFGECTKAHLRAESWVK